MSLLDNACLPLKRKGSGDWINGNWEGEIITDLPPVNGNLQPLSRRMMETLPEGRMNRESYIFIASQKLKTVADPEDATPQNADILVIDGEEFEVFASGKWRDPMLAHFEYILVKAQAVG